MKIIHLITAFHSGGAEKIAIDIANHLNCSDFNMILISIFKDSSSFALERKKELKKNNINFKELGLDIDARFLRYISILYSSFQLACFIIKAKPRIIHSHTDIPDLVLSIALRLLSVLGIKHPIIIRTIHNTFIWPTHQKIGNFTESKFIDDHVIFISDTTKKAYIKLRKKYSLPISSNTYFIANGIDINFYTHKCSRKKIHELGIKLHPDKINLLFVGRFVEQKGFDLIFDLLRKLKPIYFEKIEIYAFGHGHLIGKKMDDFPINIFLPVVGINEIYGCFDYLIMPSRFEGLPLVALEAQASKLPLIVSDAPGLNECVLKTWPLVFKNGNIDEFEKIIEMIIDDKYEPENLAQKAYNYVQNNFHIETMLMKYKKLYSKLITENSDSV